MTQFIDFIRPFVIGYAIWFGLVGLLALVVFIYVFVQIIKANRQFERDWDAATLRQDWSSGTDSPRLRLNRNRTLFRGRRAS